MKPHISRVLLIFWDNTPVEWRWQCMSKEGWGTGQTPLMAYRSWSIYKSAKESYGGQYQIIHLGGRCTH